LDKQLPLLLRVSIHVKELSMKMKKSRRVLQDLRNDQED